VLVEELAVVEELEGVMPWLMVAAAFTCFPSRPRGSVDGALVNFKVPVIV
jgi:hypothetical protein